MVGIVGLLDCWIVGLLGLLDCLIVGLLDCLIVGLLDCWMVGIVGIVGLLGLLDCWDCLIVGLLDGCSFNSKGIFIYNLTQFNEHPLRFPTFDTVIDSRAIDF
jgi:hypothetical protein